MNKQRSSEYMQRWHEANPGYRRAYYLANKEKFYTPRPRTKPKGVYFKTGRNKWRVQLQVDGVKKHMGYFATEQEALDFVRRASH